MTNQAVETRAPNRLRSRAALSVVLLLMTGLGLGVWYQKASEYEVVTNGGYSIVVADWTFGNPPKIGSNAMAVRGSLIAVAGKCLGISGSRSVIFVWPRGTTLHVADGVPIVRNNGVSWRLGEFKGYAPIEPRTLTYADLPAPCKGYGGTSVHFGR